MKSLRIILSFTILLAGCYSHTTVTTDTPSLDNEDLTFKLGDGSYIVSERGYHHRVENGFEIVGKLRHTPKDNWNTLNYQRPDSLFDGIVLDQQIKEVVVDKLETPRTILALLFPVVFIGFVFGLHITTSKVGGL